jgi:4-amino-4-deoxy-L-arabinose transferase-like glycosyltransferase
MPTSEISRLHNTRAANDSRTVTSRDVLCLTILFIVAATARLWGISKIHYWDEMVYLQNAQAICCGKINYSELAFRPPLISLFYAAIFKFWHSIYAACIGAALLNAAAPVLLFFAGRLSVGRLASLLASCLFAISPFFVGVFPAGFDSDNTGNSLLTDSPALTLITLSFWFLLRAIQKPSFFRFFLSGIALALCILMRFGSLSCVGILLFLTLLSSSRWKAVGACFCGLTAGLAPYLAWCRLRFGDPFFTLKQGWIHVEGPTAPFTFYLRNALPIFGPIVVAGFALYIAWKIFSPISKWLNSDINRSAENTQPNGLIQLYLLAWLMLECLAFSLIPHKEPRYIMPAAPPLFLLSGLGLSLIFALRRREIRWAGIGGLCVLLVLTLRPLHALVSTPFIDRTVPDEERAGRLLSETLPSDTTLYMSFNYPALTYYTSFRIHELRDVGPALYRDMSLVPPGEVLVVYKHAEAPSQADIAWCDASHLFARIAEFPSLVIYRRLGTVQPQP